MSTKKIILVAFQFKAVKIIFSVFIILLAIKVTFFISYFERPSWSFFNVNYELYALALATVINMIIMGIFTRRD